MAFQVKVSAKHENSGESVRWEFCVVVKTVVESLNLESAMPCPLRLSFFFYFFERDILKRAKSTKLSPLSFLFPLQQTFLVTKKVKFDVGNRGIEQYFATGKSLPRRNNNITTNILHLVLTS